MIRNAHSRVQGINDIYIRMCIYVCYIYVLYTERTGVLGDVFHVVRLSVYTCVLRITYMEVLFGKVDSPPSEPCLPMFHF